MGLDDQQVGGAVHGWDGGQQVDRRRNRQSRGGIGRYMQVAAHRREQWLAGQHAGGGEVGVNATLKL